MKPITESYKENIKEFGRELDSIITYTIDNEEIELGNENLNSVSPHYEGSILKSVMKQLDIECDRDIPEGTQINYRFGIKIRDEEVEDYRDNYDYIDFGNYIVYSNEKQEDTGSYKITCYDKLLYSMKDYEPIVLQYPVTIKQYITALCNRLNLEFYNASGTFANYNKTIPSDLYVDLGYTYRDVLDELAQVTASTICINEETDELEIRYITDTNDTINEEYLKDVNVNFGEQYGAVNTIVLSRSGGSDKISKSYPDDLPDEDKIAIEIADNQIMNFNDRADYLNDILSRLNGLQYYLNDFSSTGITYYNLCDRYNIQIGEETYSCVMFNDEINITQGLEENIHTDMPEESETDYTKTDKTDRRINQTYLIVDKQNQTIESVVSNVTEQNNKIAYITQTVDEINSKISDIADVTVSGESENADVLLENINTSEPIMIKIHPMNASNHISYLYPSIGLFPSDTLYPKTRTIRFIRTYTEEGETYTENIDYELPNDLLYYNSETYDEFLLDYNNEICQVIKRCGYNADGSVYKLNQEQIINYPYPTISLGYGDYEIKMLGYNYAYIFAQLMASNIYTTQFATKVELSSAITQTEQSIMLEVNEKVNEDEIIAKLNVAIEDEQGIINITGNQVIIDSDHFKLAADGSITATNVNLSGILTTYSTNGKKAVKIQGTTANFYDYADQGEYVGGISSVRYSSVGQKGISFHTIEGSRVNIGYKESESATTINPLMSFDTSDLNSVPWIKNTASGTIFPNAGGIVVKNGLITNWNVYGASGTIFSNAGSGITIKNGLITNWNISGINDVFTVTLANGKYLEINVDNGLITRAIQVN